MEYRCRRLRLGYERSQFPRELLLPCHVFHTLGWLWGVHKLLRSSMLKLPVVGHPAARLGSTSEGRAASGP